MNILLYYTMLLSYLSTFFVIADVLHQNIPKGFHVFILSLLQAVGQ